MTTFYELAIYSTWEGRIIRSFLTYEALCEYAERMAPYCEGCDPAFSIYSFSEVSSRREIDLSPEELKELCLG